MNVLIILQTAPHTPGGYSAPDLVSLVRVASETDRQRKTRANTNSHHTLSVAFDAPRH